ncbi:MAG: hypothetical protein Q9227_004188 [Pyrenula ochraceoflavens]
MKALHLPGRSPVSQLPPFTFPSSPPPPSALSFSANDVSVPSRSSAEKAIVESTSLAETHVYQVRVIFTTLTRGELTWEETLLPCRFEEGHGPVPGHDVLGIVSTVHTHKESKIPPKFRVGDRVAALLAFDRDGAAAQYTLAVESELAAAPPAALTGNSDAELATLPLSGLSVWQALFQHANFQEPSNAISGTAQRPVLLILGCTGAVGRLAVQIAKAANLLVVGASRSPSSMKNEDAEMLWEPDVAITYSQIGDATALENLSHHSRDERALEVNGIFDTTGGPNLLVALQVLLQDREEANSQSGGRLALASGAKIVSIAHPLSALPCSPETISSLESAMHGKGVEFKFFVVEPDGAQLSKIMELAIQKKLRGSVRQVYALEDGRRAMEDAEGVGTRARRDGKVVLQIDSDI